MMARENAFRGEAGRATRPESEAVGEDGEMHEGGIRALSRIRHSVADFFGVADYDEEERRMKQERWKYRSRKMHSKAPITSAVAKRVATIRLPKPHLRPDIGVEEQEMVVMHIDKEPDGGKTPVRLQSVRAYPAHGELLEAVEVRKQESGVDDTGKGEERGLLLEGVDEADSGGHVERREPSVSHSYKRMPSRIKSAGITPPSTYHKEGVVTMAWGGVKRHVSSAAGHKPSRRMTTRSIRRDQFVHLAQSEMRESSVPRSGLYDESISEEVDETDGVDEIERLTFFDEPLSTYPDPESVKSLRRRKTMPARGSARLVAVGRKAASVIQKTGFYGRPSLDEEAEDLIDGRYADDTDSAGDKLLDSLGIDSAEPELPRKIKPSIPEDTNMSAAPSHIRDIPKEDERDGFPMGRVKGAETILLETLALAGNKRIFAEGVAGRCLGFVRQPQPKDVEDQIAQMEADMHRPYFTYWVTLVQLVCLIVAVSVYGFAPIGFSQKDISEVVLTTSLTEEHVDRREVENMWIGPRQADLIHMGARYTLCMRRDINLERQTKLDQRKENKTACCVRNDGSGAVQTSRDKCSPRLSTWLKWNGTNNQLKHKSGSVCKLDPRFCSNPSSLLVPWPDDITEWPICREVYKTNKTNATKEKPDEFRHMLYDVIGRPCCIGIQGQCVIVTREHCTFLRGYFHEEASLCSQVNCLEEICGMIPFWNPIKPDQFYRLWTSLFLHAGVIELVISMVVQLIYLRDLEIFAGWRRISIIYIFSGIGGSLASALFVPYHVETGPSSAQFGLLACALVDVINNWKIIDGAAWALGKLIVISIVCFLVGFLPLVDNWANMFGFCFGFLLSFALLPYIKLNKEDQRNKIIGIVICLTVCIFLFVAFIVLFYAAPVHSCENCQYFNCLPFTDTFCDQAEVRIVRTDL